MQKVFPYFCLFYFWSPQPVMAKKMSQEEAVKIIQVAERARQGRERATFNMKNLNMNTIYRIKEPGAESAESAAVCIQKVHRYSHTTCHMPSSFLCKHSFMLTGIIECNCRCGRATCRGRGQKLPERRR